MKDRSETVLVQLSNVELEQLVTNAARRAAETVAEAAPRFLTNVQVCEMLGVSKPTVTALVRDGLPAIRVGRELRFEREAVVEWLREHRSETPKKSPPKRGHLRSI